MLDQTKHSIFLISAFFVTSTMNYGFGVALSWFLTPDQFGVLGVAQSLLLLLALVVGSGFAWTANHDIASRGVTDETRGRFRAAWSANFLLGLLVGVCLWILYRINLLPLGDDYRLIIPLVGFTIVILAARSVLNGAARGQQRFGQVTINLIIEVVIKIILGLALVAFGLGVPGVFIGFAIGALASIVHSLRIIHPDRLWHGKGWFDGEVIRATIPLFASILGTALMLNLDVLGLKLLAPPDQGDLLSGYYQAAVILARTPVFLAQALTLVMFSHIAAGLRRNPASKNQRTIVAHGMKALRSWLRFLAPVGLVLIVAPQTVMAVFFPPQYRVATVPLQVAALGGLLLSLANLLNGVLLAAGDRRRPAVVAGFATLIQILILIVFVPRYGILAAALSLVAAGFLFIAGLYILIFEASGRGLGYQLFLQKIVNRPGIFLPLTVLAFSLALIPDTNWVSLLLQLLLAGIFYLFALTALNWKTLNFKQPISSFVVQFFQVLIGV